MEIGIDHTEEKCPVCKKGTMKKAAFRTGSVDKPGAQVKVCKKCGHRVETSTTPPTS